MISVIHPVALLTNLIFSFIYVKEINFGNDYRDPSFINVYVFWFFTGLFFS